MSRVLCFRGVRVFDGRGIVDADTVVVRDGTIAAVGEHPAGYPDAATMDGDGTRTLLPGLIDCHTHMSNPAALRQALTFGVTTELNLGDHPELIRQVKQELAGPGGAAMADVFSSMSPVTPSGGWGTQFAGLPTLDTPEEAQAFVDARIAEGSDLIKIRASDGQLATRFFGHDPMPALGKIVMTAVAAAAHRRQKQAIAHIGTLDAADDAIEAGVDGLAHIFADRMPDPEFAARAAAAGIFVIPTLTMWELLSGDPAALDVLGDQRLAPYLVRADIDALHDLHRTGTRRRLPLNLSAATAAVGQLRDAGVPILAGSDWPGGPHGVRLHREFELLVRAGLTAAEALTAATAAPAAQLGFTDRGRIAPGLRADLLLVDGDPTAEITAIRAIVGVWKRGVPVERSPAGALAGTPAAAPA